MLLFNLYHLHFQLEGLRSYFFGFPDRRRKSFLQKRLINKIINFAFNVSSVMVTPSVESTLYTDCEKLVSPPCIFNAFCEAEQHEGGIHVLYFGRYQVGF